MAKGPGSGAPKRKLARWLLGVGALATLLGGVISEISVLLLCIGVPADWLVYAILAGITFLVVGGVLLVMGKRWDSE